MSRIGSINITYTQSVANNTSTITVKGIIQCTGESYRGDHRTGTYTIKKGSTVIASGSFTHGAPANSTTTLFTKTFTVNHASDGSYGSITATYNYDSGWATATQSKTIPTIARQSAFKSVDQAIIGETTTIEITRNSSSFTHNIYYRIGTGSWITGATGVGTSASFTLDMSLCNQITNSTSGALQLMLRTYNGTTKIGSDVTTTVTAYVPDSVVPSISSITLSEATEDVNSTFGCYVQNISTLNVKVTASGTYGSTIKSYRTSIDGITYTSNEFTTDPIVSNGILTIRSTVTDSRNRTATKTTTINVVEYYRPDITNFWVKRCLQDGTLAENDGTYVKFTIGYDIAPINNKNTKKASIQYYDGSNWTDIVVYTDVYSKASNTTYVSTQQFSVDNSYQFRLYLEDYFYNGDNGVAFGQKIEPSYTLMNYHKSGKSIGFGKVAQKEEGFQFGDFIYDQWDTVITNGLAVYGGDPDTTLESLIMTSTNSPNGQAMFFHTFFSSNKTNTQNCGQLALPYYYNGTQSMYWRYRFGGVWSEWNEVANASDLETLIEYTNDSGWIRATLEEPFSFYGSSGKAEYRKIGKMVQIRGLLSSVEAIEYSTTQTTIFTLEEGFYPSMNTYQLCQGSQNCSWLLGVGTAGDVTFGRYRNGDTNTTAPSGVWLPFSITYFVD